MSDQNTKLLLLRYLIVRAGHGAQGVAPREVLTSWWWWHAVAGTRVGAADRGRQGCRAHHAVASPPSRGPVPQRRLVMDEATFLALTFDAALTLAEGAAVDYQEEHASTEGREVQVWYANRLLVQ